MEELTPAALRATLGRARELLAEPSRLAAVQARAMAQDFSWQASAREYVKLYQGLLRPSGPEGAQ
jgi:starch synthase